MPGDYLQNQSDYVQSGYIGNEGSPVKFTLNGVDTLFDRSPLRPDRGASLVQASTVSAGAERIGQPHRGNDDLLDLRWPSVSAIDRDKILSFWLAVRGMAKTFSYTDLDGNTMTVRFAKPARPYVREKAYGTYEVSIQLRIV